MTYIIVVNDNDELKTIDQETVETLILNSEVIEDMINVILDERKKAEEGDSDAPANDL